MKEKANIQGRLSLKADIRCIRCHILKKFIERVNEF